MNTKLSPFKNLIPVYSIIVITGAITAFAIIIFKVISLLVLYHYMRLDVYLCLVAISFFVAGLFFNKIKQPSKIFFPPKDLLVQLSVKELQVLALIAEGKTNKEIASIQFIEISTVKTHINNIYSKLSVSNRKEARLKYNELKISCGF